MDGQAVSGGVATQGALGFILNNKALTLDRIVERLRFKLDGYL
jgi:hypothetical protein